MTVQGNEQRGADQGLLKARYDVGQLRTGHNGKEDSLGITPAFIKQIEF